MNGPKESPRVVLFVLLFNRCKFMQPNSLKSMTIADVFNETDTKSLTVCKIPDNNSI